MREDACKDCRIWEDELYWTHFQYIHFLQILQPGFDQHLAIPEKFTRNLRRKLPDKVALKGPSGTSWEICLTAHENTLYFNQGWQEFIEDHSLEENDILQFKYDGDSGFDVLMFDGQSLCEKAGSYFLTKCVHKEHDTALFDTKTNLESSIEILSMSSEDFSEGIKRKKTKHPNVYTTSGRLIVSRVADEKPQKKMKLLATVGTKKTAKKDTCACAKDVETRDIVHTPQCLSSRRWIPEEHRLNALQTAQKAETTEGFVADEKPRKKMKLPASVGTTRKAKMDTCACAKDVETGDIVHTPKCLSSRRWIPEEHKLKALQMAQEVVTPEGFVAAIRSTQITRSFLPLPKTWASKHINYRKNRNITVRIKDKTWKMQIYYGKSSNQGGLGSGLKKFVVDNNIKEFDVCVFEPSVPSNKTIILDATIFHVVQEMSLPSAATQGAVTQDTMLV